MGFLNRFCTFLSAYLHCWCWEYFFFFCQLCLCFGGTAISSCVCSPLFFFFFAVFCVVIWDNMKSIGALEPLSFCFAVAFDCTWVYFKAIDWIWNDDCENLAVLSGLEYVLKRNWLYLLLVGFFAEQTVCARKWKWIIKMLAHVTFRTMKQVNYIE